jgi:L-rhamnose isomerase/sugar isomerase
VAPSVALHIPWDRVDDWAALRERADELGLRLGAINPNLFQDPDYKLGSLCHPDADVRRRAVDHVRECVGIARAVGSDAISLWLADGTNYPGQDSLRDRRRRLLAALAEIYAELGDDVELLVEYKLYEPAFHATDLADWGSALLACQALGERAKVLVDLGHHAHGVNIEQIVALLHDAGRLGGFHFNDRKYADDDLTLGSIDPYQLFRIFHEIVSASADEREGIAFMIDQSHNLKGKVEAMVQSVVTAQELYAKAALIDQEKLAELQDACRLVEAEECFRTAFWQDVRPLVREWRTARGLPADPLKALAASGYVEKITKERGSRNARSVSTYA